MYPDKLSDSELASLKALSRLVTLVSVPKQHEEKLKSLGLVEQKLGGLGLTAKGRRALMNRGKLN